MKVSTGKFIGSTLIVAGTAIGAGMLALPITAAQLGFWKSLLFFIAIWGLMAYLALLSLEINLYVGRGITIGKAAQRFLGTWGNIVSTLSFVFLLYALLAAYIAGGSSILGILIDFPFSEKTLLLIFALGLGVFVFIHTKAVDYVNRLLFGAKMIFFLMLLLALGGFIRLENLNANLFLSSKSVSLALPIFFTSFGFHICIHTIVDYVGPQHVSQLKRIFIWGSFIPLALYSLWIMGCLGTLPLKGDISFSNVFSQNNDVGLFLEQINALTASTNLNLLTNVFSVLAISTSFLGVCLGLFDYLAALFAIPNSYSGRLGTITLTLALPIAIAWVYPKGFISVLGYAALMLSLFAILIPVCIVVKLRRQGHYAIPYRAPGGALGLTFAFLAGCTIVGLELFTVLG